MSSDIVPFFLMMMITRSKSSRRKEGSARRVFFIPVVALVLVAGLVVLFKDVVRTEATRFIAHASPGSEESDRTKYQAVLYEIVSEENARLSALLSLPQDGVAATGRVVARPPRTLYDTLLVAIDPGAGIRMGDHALFEGILLGTVTSVSGGSATVSLHSSSGATTEAKTGTPSAIVVLTGLGGGAFTFEVPSAVSLNAGDRVMDALGMRQIAWVRSVEIADGRDNRAVYAYAPVSLSDLDFVRFMHPH